MKRIFIIGSILLLAGCSLEPGSEKWCALKKEQAKSEWSGSDAVTFAKHCILDSTAVGGKNWCEDMVDKPKGEWTASDTASYAKYCVL